ncbi:metal-dependent hydrolase [compost metagenome]
MTVSRWIFSLLGLAALTAAPVLAVAQQPPASPAASGAAQPAWIRTSDAARPVGKDELAVRWLGTAAFEVRTATTSILIDPHFSRHNLVKLLAGPLSPDLERIKQHLPKSQAVFVGHSHHDHMVDAPTVAKLLGAPLYGSEDTSRVALGEGLDPGRVKTLQGGERVTVGDLVIEAIPSEHSDIITNWIVNGRIAPDAKPPMRFSQYKHGPVFIYAIHWRGRTVYHFGSAEMIDATMKGRHADVAMICLSGWKDNRPIFGRIAKTLTPDVVVPMHHDDFFKPLDEGFHPGQLAYVDEAYPAIARDMPQSALVKLDFFQEFRLQPAETRR